MSKARDLWTKVTLWFQSHARHTTPRRAVCRLNDVIGEVGRGLIIAALPYSILFPA